MYRVRLNVVCPGGATDAMNLQHPGAAVHSCSSSQPSSDRSCNQGGHWVESTRH